MSLMLVSLAQTCINDTVYREIWNELTAERHASIPKFRDITTLFLAGALTIKQLCEQLDQALKGQDWGARGTGFLLPLNQLAWYSGQEGETGLRHALDGLNASTMGQRIEQFYAFLTTDWQRLAQEGTLTGRAHPVSSAFIISLFAFWLDHAAEPPVYSNTLRRGIKMLLDAGLLPAAQGLRTGYESIEICTEADHVAALHALAALTAAAPSLKTLGPYWAEVFLHWVAQNADVLSQGQESLASETSLLPDRTIAESRETYSARPIIKDLPLTPTPEPLLTHLIQEVRQHIMVEAATIRRIYHALLAGHVILTGPPGTGKTQLALLIPHLLWQREEHGARTTRTAYATRLVTATDEWSVRTLIGGLAPVGTGGQISYRIQYGYLTETLLENWAVSPALPAGWRNPQRITVKASAMGQQETLQEFRGRWLVIDEFNRAPIDLAFGEALTALGGTARLRVPIEGGSAELPFPQDFRIIGTLNSFDRSYLNQISEALKRRFSFIEVLPPSRAERADEQTTVFSRALHSIAHLHDGIRLDERRIVWEQRVTFALRPDGSCRVEWDETARVLEHVLETAWRIVEVVRIYRQIGTAQAIALVRALLIEGMLQDYTSRAEWFSGLDRALCDTLADQLQVLLTDELEVLLLYLNHELTAGAFVEHYHRLLAHLDSPRRRVAHLEALSMTTSTETTEVLSERMIASLVEQEEPEIPYAMLQTIFHLDHPRPPLPQFVRRLRRYKMEHGL